MRSLSILFTNSTLSLRAGSELWVRDVCRTLVERGHRPVAFSLVTGAIADELRAATVPVVSDLDNIAFTPDLIHGHHHIETLIAALHFPGVPIVHVCHGWLPWEEGPLRHPSIARYVAVDETCVDRLTAESGIGRDQIDLLLNFVDVKRFARRDALPRRPRKALVLSNGADEHGYAAIIRRACLESGIELEIAGLRSGRVVERPQELLPGFDLVFAKARSALEALAVGCSVILADVVGGGPLVTERDFDRMRACNFGVRLLQHAHSVEWYRAQIAAYDAADATRISTRAREDADLEVAVDRLLDIYAKAMVDHQRHASSAGSNAQSCTDAQRAAARHLSSVALRLKGAYELEIALHKRSGELAAAYSRHDLLVQELAAAHSSHGLLVHELGSAYTRHDLLVRDLTAALSRHDLLVHEREALQRQTETLTNELTAARSLNEQLTNERDVLQQLVAAYRALPSLRLRDGLMRMPILGNTAQRAARWLTRSTLLR
jgi:glycosyltransferase involved in cell wall biosynthesis